MSNEDSKKTLQELIDKADEIYSFYFKYSKKRKDSRYLYEKAFRKAKEENNKLQMEYIQGKINLIDREYNNALYHFEKSIKYDNSFLNGWIFKGTSLLHLERYDDALKCYNKALEIDPENNKALNNKGASLIYLKRYDDALNYFERVLNTDPDNSDAWNNKGLILDFQNNFDEALKCYDKSLEINPMDNRTWFNKGNALGALNRYIEALDCYSKALEIDPDYKNALNNKGITLTILKRYEDALKCYNKALEIDPNDDLIKDNRILVLTYLGKSEADDELEEFYSKIKEDIEESDASEEQTKERFLELDAQKEVRKELGLDLEKMLDEKKKYENKLAKSLEPRSESLKDNFFIVLRRWNSYTPTMITSTESNLGGGYFLYWKGKGIVIDPGFDFLTNFFSNGLLVHDIDAVIITHAHIDHCNDFESILTLIYKYNKENKANKKIDVFMNLGAMKKFLGWIPIEKDDQDPKINRIYSLEEGITISPDNYQMRIIPKKAIHNEILSKCYSVGVILELYDQDNPDDETFKIGYTSDTRHNEEVEGQYDDVDILIPNMGSIEPIDIKPVEDKGLKRDKNHLMLTGVISAIYKSNAKLAIISEFGEELGAQRVKIVNALNNVFQANGRTRCMTGDIGLTVKIPEFDDLENLQVRCAICSYRNNKELYDKINKRPAYCCFEGNGEVYVELKNILEGLDPQNKPEKSVIDFCKNCKPSYEIL